MNPTMEVRILEGASILFYKFGFSRVRFSEIAREVGITTRTIYNYFPNKLMLANAVSEYTIDKILKDMEALLETDLAFPDMIIKLFEQLYEELNTRLPAYRSSSILPGNSHPDPITVDPSIETLIVRLFNIGVHEGVLAEDAPFEVLIQILLCQVNYCFPSDGARSSESVSQEYFLKSMLLILKSCLTEKGQEQFSRYS